jgi:hypothetical protein
LFKDRWILGHYGNSCIFWGFPMKRVRKINKDNFVVRSRRSFSKTWLIQRRGDFWWSNWTQWLYVWWVADTRCTMKTVYKHFCYYYYYYYYYYLFFFFFFFCQMLLKRHIILYCTLIRLQYVSCNWIQLTDKYEQISINIYNGWTDFSHSTIRSRWFIYLFIYFFD